MALQTGLSKATLTVNAPPWGGDFLEFVRFSTLCSETQNAYMASCQSTLGVLVSDLPADGA